MLSAIVPADFAFKQALVSYTPRLIEADKNASAAVALILRQNSGEFELLMIKRAEHRDDPWSGQIGLPGGRFDHADETLQHTAERETFEELGVQLRPQDYCARLNDYQSRPQRSVALVTVSSFVYQLERWPELIPNAEVAAAFWVPLSALVNPANKTHYRPSSGSATEWPATTIQIRQTRYLLWGLTHRIVNNLLKIAYTSTKQSEEQ